MFVCLCGKEREGGGKRETHQTTHQTTHTKQHANLEARRVERSLRERRMGTSDMVSVPPATQTSAWPVARRPAHEAMAWLDEMHAIVTVCAGVLRLNPASSIACGRHARAHRHRHIMKQEQRRYETSRSSNPHTTSYACNASMRASNTHTLSLELSLSTSLSQPLSLNLSLGLICPALFRFPPRGQRCWCGPPG